MCDVARHLTISIATPQLIHTVTAKQKQRNEKASSPGKVSMTKKNVSKTREMPTTTYANVVNQGMQNNLEF